MPPLATKTAHTQGIAFGKEFNINTPTQPRLSNYPVTVFGKEKRSFHSSWYSIPTCASSLQDGKFTKTGFRNWHKAMEKGCGLYAHNVSVPHINAMKRWDERNRREKEGFSVDQLAVDKSVEEQTLFMEAVL